MKKDQNFFTDSNRVKQERLVNYILTIVGRYYNVDENYITTKNRKREIVFARQVSMYLLCKYSKDTLQNIGKRFGDKNHATILHGKKVVVNLMESYPKIKNEIEELENMIKLNYITVKNNVLLNDHFYFIDFNNHSSYKINNKKGIILTGFTEEEKEQILKNIEGIVCTKEHVNTGLYILEKN